MPRFESWRVCTAGHHYLPVPGISPSERDRGPDVPGLLRRSEAERGAGAGEQLPAKGEATGVAAGDIRFASTTAFA